MGVNGLTTYLREHMNTLSKRLECSADFGRINVVVDGWSFIYEVYSNSGLAWVYGGEYQDFNRHVEKLVRAWIEVGLNVYFVFDGPSPPLKFPTIMKRLRDSRIQHSMVFFRTSPAARSTPRSLREMSMLPPRCYASCLHVLREIAASTECLEIHFADEEGDPYSVELAARLSGYVIGTDSDFVVLHTNGYRGYIPLDQMVWISPVAVEDDNFDETEEDGFQTVRKGKGKAKRNGDTRSGGALLPPDNTAGPLVLALSVYEPEVLGAHLKIPVTLLPLLGALVGNDYSPFQRSFQSMSFEHRLSPSQRITRVATTLQSILAASSTEKRKGKQLSSVMDLIDKTVAALLVRPVSTLVSGELDTIKERIVSSTLQYAIPRYDDSDESSGALGVTGSCALHDADICPLVALFTRFITPEMQDPERTTRRKLAEMYLKAYRTCRLSPRIVDILNSATHWPAIFLENPDLETASVSIGRTLREWIYAILDDGIGLLQGPEEDGEEGHLENDDMEDQDQGVNEQTDVVVDEANVNETGEDLLAPLRGALQQLRTPDAEASLPLPRNASSPTPSRSTISWSNQSAKPARPKIVREFARRGVRIATEDVTVPPISQLLASVGMGPDDDSTDDNFVDPLPLPLWPEEKRFTLLLRILGSDFPDIRDVNPNALSAVLAVRHVVQVMHVRAIGNAGNKEREQEKWTEREARAFLRSFTLSQCSTARPPRPIEAAQPPIINRHVQLTAQLLVALESLEHLTHVLFLSDRVVDSSNSFCGREFHAQLACPHTQAGGIGVDESLECLWSAVTPGMQCAFAGEPPSKKPRRRGEPTRQGRESRAQKGSIPRGGFYSVLGEEIF